MREVRNAFLQQRIFFTEATQGQKILGKNRASVFQGRHLLGPERFNLNTENTWAVENKKTGEWRRINVLLLAENCTFFVLDRCSLNFAELLYLLASLMKLPSEVIQGCPGAPSLSLQRLELPGLRLSLRAGAKARLCQRGTFLPWFADQTGNSVPWKLAEGLARWTEHMDAVNCSRSSPCFLSVNYI